jgi:hypothetical protein
MSDRRPAQRTDCVGCRDERFHTASGQRCWAFSNAVVVEKIRVPEGHPIEAGERVQRPSCFSQPGFMHLTAMNGATR